MKDHRQRLRLTPVQCKYTHYDTISEILHERMYPKKHTDNYGFISGEVFSHIKMSPQQVKKMYAVNAKHHQLKGRW